MLMEKSRCMLNGAKLRQNIWAEAMGIVCYLVNRPPSSTLVENIPHKVWTGKKTSHTQLGYLVVMSMFTFQGKHE
jgi:hypothetical protein